MIKKKTLRQGQGRREFFSCYDTIKELTERGWNMTMIYEKLTAEGLVTMSYSAFYDGMTQRKRKRKMNPLAEVAVIKPLVQSIRPVPPEMPLFDPAQQPTAPSAPVAAPAPPARQFPISLHGGQPEKPQGRKPKRAALQGTLDGYVEKGAQLETQTAPVDDDPEYAAKKSRVTGKKTAKGK